tara:strand:+ start:213 stop:470 length:258 start_codon:yes stop_codon:yes gene_type:complete
MGYMKEMAISQANQELEELYSNHAMEQNILREEALHEQYVEEERKENQKMVTEDTGKLMFGEMCRPIKIWSAIHPSDRRKRRTRR